MKLYTIENSGNAYKVRILLSLLGIRYETVMLNDAAREYREPWFLKLNPRGEVPVLDDDGTIVWDSAACLTYLARKYGGERWLPTAPAELAEIMQWLALAASEIQFGLQYARRGVKSGRWTAGDLATCHATARVALTTLEGRLNSHEWLALDRTTIADIACFPYVETAADGKVSLEPYPAVRGWLARCKALPEWARR
jgi:glutathione S-transferase